MNKSFFRFFTVVLALLLAGCSLRKPEKTVAESTEESNSQTITQDISQGIINDTRKEFQTEQNFDRTQIMGGKSISVKASIAPMPVESLHNVTLESDKTAWEAMVQEIIKKSFPNASNISLPNDTQIFIEQDGQTNMSFYFEDSLGPGGMYYTDYNHDLNGSTLDTDGMSSQPDYMTTYIPSGMNVSADEATREVIEQLNSYSCFDFLPWNTTAGFDAQKSEGYYHIKLRQTYEEIPIYGNSVYMISAFFSNAGMFACQGTVHLKEASHSPIATVFPLEQAVENFFSNYLLYAVGNQVVCKNIKLGYIADSENGKINLAPAWIFECQDTVNAGETSVTVYYNCGFCLENGNFWIDS